MSTLAKITGVFIFIIGILLVLAGIVVGVMGLFRGGIVFNRLPLAPGSPFLGPAQAFSGFGLFAGLGIFLYGLVVITFGEVTYLVGDIARNTQETKRILVNWLRRPEAPAITGPTQSTGQT